MHTAQYGRYIKTPFCCNYANFCRGKTFENRICVQPTLPLYLKSHILEGGLVHLTKGIIRNCNITTTSITIITAML